jgi:protein-tyrosine phosphatase
MDEIIPHLWLGDMNDGKNAPESFHVLSVMWNGEPGQDHRCHKIPTTDYQMFQEYNGQVVQAEGVQTNTEKMDEAADMIDKILANHQDILVHCAYGVERSPLTIVWYLMRYHSMNLKEAYDLVMSKRVQAQYRGAWLPPEVRLSGQLPEPVK